MNKWTSINERFPIVGAEVLAAFKGQFRWVVFVATMSVHQGLVAPGYAPATHWIPLPAPPTE